MLSLQESRNVSTNARDAFDADIRATTAPMCSVENIGDNILILARLVSV